MTECPFCKILAGELAASFVYQDEICSAIMDIQPVNAGHILILPNKHAASLSELPAETGSHIFILAQKLAQAVRKSGLECEGINLFVADGEAAMQTVPHFHLHIIPRYAGDGFSFQFSPRYAELPTREELEDHAYHIKQAFKDISGQ